MNQALLREFQQKEMTPAQAAALVKSGDTVYIGACTSYARGITDALSARAGELENVTLACSNIFPPFSPLDCEGREAFRINTFFMGYEERRGIGLGMTDFTSVHLSQVDQWCRETCPADIAFFDVSLPDENGYMSFGASGCCMHTFVREKAKTIVLQVNRHAPYVYGEENLIHISQAQHIVRMDVAKEEVPIPPENDDPEIQQMSDYLLDQIPDGACLQLGIGGVSSVVGYGLKHKNDLGIHTELMTDSMMFLMKEGVVNNSRKNFLPGRSVAGFAFGSQELYEFLDHNEKVYFGPFPLVNNCLNVAKNDNVVSINTAVSMDLMGQVAAESIGLRQYSGVGGQLDFIRGAQLSKGGKSFLAFKSTVGVRPDGAPMSRIVPVFPANSVITTPRADVQYVVTEYGCVNLKVLSMRDRVRAMISLAHPDCRPELTSQAKALGLL